MTASLSEFMKHIDDVVGDCCHVLVECGHECGQKVERKHLWKHQYEECVSKSGGLLYSGKQHQHVKVHTSIA